MAKVIAIMSMSLDGYVADRSDGVAEVFDWYTAGDVVVPIAASEMTFRVSAPSAAHLLDLMGDVGAMFTGRRRSKKPQAGTVSTRGEFRHSSSLTTCRRDGPVPAPPSTSSPTGSKAPWPKRPLPPENARWAFTAATPSGSASTPGFWTRYTLISSRCCSDPESRC